MTISAASGSSADSYDMTLHGDDNRLGCATVETEGVDPVL